MFKAICNISYQNVQPLFREDCFYTLVESSRSPFTKLFIPHRTSSFVFEFLGRVGFLFQINMKIFDQSFFLSFIPEKLVLDFVLYKFGKFMSELKVALNFIIAE